jgi:hypothetical protein
MARQARWRVVNVETEVQLPRCTSLVLDTGSSSYGRSLTARPRGEEKTGECGKEQHELLGTAL